MVYPAASAWNRTATTCSPTAETCGRQTFKHRGAPEIRSRNARGNIGVDHDCRYRSCDALPPHLAGLPDGFKPAQYEFAITYLANNFNASAAARIAYPKQWSNRHLAPNCTRRVDRVTDKLCRVCQLRENLTK